MSKKYVGMHHISDIIINENNTELIEESSGDDASSNNDLHLESGDNLTLIPSSRLKQGGFLGNGAFGKVYDGEYKGVAVAIKWLEMDHARRYLGGSVSDEEIIESFDWEAANLSLVNHPNIISLISIVDSGDGRRGLVLECVMAWI